MTPSVYTHRILCEAVAHHLGRRLKSARGADHFHLVDRILLCQRCSKDSPELMAAHLSCRISPHKPQDAAERFGKEWTAACTSWGASLPDGELRYEFSGEILGVPDGFEERIARAGRVRVRIDSMGGDGRAGLAIGRILNHAHRERRIPVRVEILRAWSAATLIALGGSERVIDRAGSIMCHEISSVHFGTAAEFLQASQNLENLKREIEGFISETTRLLGCRAWDLVDGPEVTFTGEEAVVAGLVHKVEPLTPLARESGDPPPARADAPVAFPPAAA